jgi:hypothetical protein
MYALNGKIKPMQKKNRVESFCFQIQKRNLIFVSEQSHI